MYTTGSTVGRFFPASAVEADPAIAHEDWETIERSPDFLNFSRAYVPQESV
jgi:hypothetical protein